MTKNLWVRIHVPSVEVAECSGKVLRFADEQTALNARETEWVNLPVKTGTHFSDEALPITYASRISLLCACSEMSSCHSKVIQLLWMFIRQFHVHVWEKPNDGGQQVMYLLLFCREEKREVIEKCVMLSLGVGHKMTSGVWRAFYGVRTRFLDRHWIGCMMEKHWPVRREGNPVLGIARRGAVRLF